MGEEVCCLQALQNDSRRQSAQLAVCHLFLCEQACFAKYDAVALYLSRRKYPPGLTYVEKNTFRRFCKKFVIKGLQRKIFCQGGSLPSGSSVQTQPIKCDFVFLV